MQIAKYKAATLTAIIVLAGISLCWGIWRYYTIHNTGSIGPLKTRPSVAKSEIRALFVHAFSLINPNFELIAQTAKDYDVNTLVVEIMGNDFVRYPSKYVPSGEPVLSEAIAATHARGIKLHISMNVLLGVPWEVQGQPVNGQQVYGIVGSDGNTRNWMCPTNPNSRTLLRNLVEEVVSNYDIDGFMFDYIRYDLGDECYCEYCRQKFVQDTGLTDVNWRADVVEGGRYHKQFMQWRIKPITELVRDMRSWMLAIKPNLEISAAVWGWEPGWPTYNRYWIGQDSVEWVKEGYLDWVSPMIYTTNLNTIRASVLDYLEYMVAGPEGKIPLVPFLTNAWPRVVAPQDFKQQIDLVRSLGVDGWIIWRYGGPGDGEGSGAPDIRNYLNLINRLPVFSIKNINTSPGTSSSVITWTTDLPATSKVEYSTSPLFTSSFVYDPRVDFSYWDVDHVAGIIVEDATPVTDHSITLTGLQKGKIYYYRVQSQDVSGTATSEVYTFEL